VTLLKPEYRAGDWVIYRKQKSSTVPGPRATNVHAASKGNLYRYTVDKFWVIDSIENDGTLQLRTRRGKRHRVAQDDPQLRKARIWERWLHRNRFESIASTPVANDDAHEGPGDDSTSMKDSKSHNAATS
jgi:hypothetical protein